jgi:broad specificity phosphatase PhoE
VQLALIRHGLTSWNLQKRIQGRIDQPLSDSGRLEMSLFSIPHPYTELCWYCSPLQRARQSADLLGLSGYGIESSLIEMNWGDWEGEILKPLRKKLGSEMRDNESRGVDFCPPNGESPRQVQQRVKAWAISVAGSDPGVGAVVHQGIIRAVYAMAFNWDMCGESPVDFNWRDIHLFRLSPEGEFEQSYQSIPLVGS